MKNVKFKNLAINFCSNSTFFASEIIRFLWGGLLNSVLELDMKAPVRSLLQLFSNIHQIHNFHFDEKANTKGLKRNCNRNFMQRWQYPIYNSTLETLIRLKMCHYCKETAYEIKIFKKKQKHWYLIHTWSDKAFKGTVLNRTLPSLHGGSLEIMFTFP